MPWAKVDDQLHAHPKWRRATKGARALWTTALSWCSSRPSDGHVPADMLRLLDGTRAEAACLVRVGLWDATDDGYVFHEWAERNPDASSVRAGLNAKSEGGKRGNHTKWHVNRGVVDPDCEHCASDKRSHTESHGDQSSTRPDPTRPDPTDTETPTESLSAATADAPTSKKQRRTRLPASWAPTDEHRQRATDAHLDIEREATKFRAHAEETGRTAQSWNGAFTRWLMNAEEFAANRPGAARPALRGVGNQDWLYR